MRKRLAIVILDAIDINISRYLKMENLLNLYNTRHSDILCCSTFPHTCPSNSETFSPASGEEILNFWIENEKLGGVWIDPAAHFKREKPKNPVDEDDVRLLGRGDLPWPFLWDVAEHAGLKAEVVQLPFILPPFSFNAHRETVEAWFPCNAKDMKQNLRDKYEITLESLKNPELDLYITSMPFPDKWCHGIGEGAIDEAFMQEESQVLDQMVGDVAAYCEDHDWTYVFFGDHGTPGCTPNFNKVWKKKIICVVHKQHSIIVSNQPNPPQYTGDMFTWFLEILGIPRSMVAKTPILGEFSEADKTAVLERLKALGYV